MEVIVRFHGECFRDGDAETRIGVSYLFLHTHAQLFSYFVRFKHKRNLPVSICVAKITGLLFSVERYIAKSHELPRHTRNMFTYDNRD